MDPKRRSTRHLEPNDGSSPASVVDPFRASTGDSGRGTMTSSERASTVETVTSPGASSSLSRDTPLNDDDENGSKKCQDEQPGKSNKNLKVPICIS